MVADSNYKTKKSGCMACEVYECKYKVKFPPYIKNYIQELKEE